MVIRITYKSRPEKFLRRLAQFCRKLLQAAADTVVSFFRDAITYTEAVAILIFASLGINALLGEIPFFWTMPMWLEAELVIPALAVVCTLALLKSSDWRSNRRLQKLVA